MMKILLLVTNHFPYGKAETFIENEYPFLARHFDKIIIISRNVKDSDLRPVSGNTTVYRHDPSTRGFKTIITALQCLWHLPLITQLFFKEIKHRSSRRIPISTSQKLFLLKRIIKAIELKKFIIAKISHYYKTEAKIVAYSYWFTASSLAISMLKDKKNLVKISRAHGFDLYEFAAEKHYLPLAKYCQESLNGLFFISEHGRNYFKRFSENNKNLFVSKLGVKSNIGLPPVDNDSIRLVSCSSMKEVKRIHLIIDLIARLEFNKKIEWVHFGDGPLYNQLKKLCINRLGNRRNIKYTFMGHIPNKDLLNHYSKNHFHFFINLSFSEGLPVSIMEAMAYGIPVIATDTGGSAEIVNNKNGLLVPVDFDPEVLAQETHGFIKKNINNWNQLRNEIISFWDENFNSEKNYSYFTQSIDSLFKKQQGHRIYSKKR